MEKPPKILKVRDPTPDEVQKERMPPPHPNLPKIDGFGGGAMVLLISPVKTGKSTILSNLLLNKDFYDGQNRFDDVHIMSNTIANDITSRYLKKAFTTYDHYDDNVITDLINGQKKYPKQEQPEVALIVDDCLGSVPQNGELWKLCSRFRHYNFKLFCISSQNFKAVSPVARQNATNVIIGSPFPNQSELGKVAESYGDLFGGQRRFMEIYKKATPDRYNFLHLDLQSNPPIAYKNFDEVIAVGGQGLGEVDDNLEL